MAFRTRLTDMDEMRRPFRTPLALALATLLAAVPARAADDDAAEDSTDESSSSIVDALGGDEDPAAKRARELAEEEAKKADDRRKATKAAEDAADGERPVEETPDVEETPAVAAKPEAKPEAAPVAPGAKIIGADGIDPLTGVKLGSSGRRQTAHVIIARKERAEGRSEVSLSNPIQIAGRFTNQIGLSLDLMHHFREAFAVTVGGTWYYYGEPSHFTKTLPDRANQTPVSSDAVILKWQANAGLELSPIYGKFALFDWTVVQFGYYLGVGGGIADTKLFISTGFGDTGLRPIGYLNTGFRLFLSEHFALRFEIRDTTFSSQVSTINGCSSTQLGGSGGGTCKLDKFVEGDRESAKQVLENDLGQSGTVHNIAFALAISVLF